jgi:hypothetical protein
MSDFDEGTVILLLPPLSYAIGNREWSPLLACARVKVSANRERSPATDGESWDRTAAMAEDGR